MSTASSPPPAPKAPVVDHILDLVGDTPLVALDRVRERGAQVWGKCEYLNPGGSVKDRICMAMLDEARRTGQLRSGQPVVEPTSGNTGIGLALCCAVRGHPLTLTMPESMSLERRALLKAYGATIVLTPAEDVMNGAIKAAKRIAREQGAFMPEQFSNPANPDTHERRTAQEIIDELDGRRVDAFVAAVGTGGTVSGVGRALKRHHPHTIVVAVEPVNSPVLSGGEAGPTKIQGIGAGFIPANYDESVVDRLEQVTDEDAWRMKTKLATHAGLLVGISAGANVCAAVQLASRLDPEQNVVTVLCDTGERYFSLAEHFPPQ